MTTDLIAYCAHDLSLTGAERPILEMGRFPVLWRCDGCDTLVLNP